MDRERLIDEVLMLLPVLGRGLGRPGREELGEIAERGISVDAHPSPGHVQVLLALGRGRILFDSWRGWSGFRPRP